jgi:uncharacterized protein YfbU (UPF0304 family)
MEQVKSKNEYETVFIHTVLRTLWLEGLHYKEAEKKFGDMKEFAARIKKKLAEMHEHIMKAEEKHADKKQIRQLKAKYNDQYRDFYGKDYYTLEPDRA